MIEGAIPELSKIKNELLIDAFILVNAIACLPVITAIGCAFDSTAVQLRSKLQGAADVASVGAVARTSPAFIAAGVMLLDGPIPVGVIDATNIFNGNMSNATGYTLNSLTSTVAKSSSTITSTVQFSANVPTTFLGVIGKKNMTVTGTSSSTANMPTYIDFYLLLDNSDSMGIGATNADIATMVNNTPDQCALACHDTTNPNNYYNLAKSLGVTMRIDVLRTATQQLMDTATATETYSNQFRMAIYDFGSSETPGGLTTISPLTSNLSSAKTAAGTIDLMTVTGAHVGDSAFSTILPQINNAIPSPGPGTAIAPQKFLFFVSDGVADEYNSSCSTPVLNSQNACQSPLNASLCSQIKARGIQIAVLYTTYIALPTNSWYMTYIQPFNPGPYGPSPNSTIAKNMQSCASPGFYFEVSPTQGISDAMTALFQKAVANAHISS